MPLVLDDVKLSRKIMELCFTLSVANGECVTIMGPKGAGKTSLLHLIAGFEQPSSGMISFHGQNLTHLLPSSRPLTILFQDNNLFEHLTIWDNVALGLRGTLHLSYQDRQLVEQALTWVGLENWERKKPLEISLAQQQRISIARCILQRRPLFLLDDPFSMLPPHERYQILNLIRDIHIKLGLTTLMVTHYPEDALFITQKTLFISQGKVIAAGHTKNVLAQEHPDIQAFQQLHRPENNYREERTAENLVKKTKMFDSKSD